MLTVAVSIAAGIAAVVSAIPAWHQHREALCLVAILIIAVANLRGVRESAVLFGIPVYAFIFSAYLLVVGGLLRMFTGTPGTGPEPQLPAAVQVPIIWLFLRAFASGCTALTGVEAISNGVQAFRPPVSRNASRTLFWMAGILGTLFLGVTVLAHFFGVLPRDGETILSQINRAVFGRGPIYFFIQATTTAILILAANTSFADFPRLSSILARDHFLPRQLANLGDRLVFSNGVLLLALAAGGLIIHYRGEVHALIPLYMVGVFISFTLSEAGMVLHWRKSRAPGYRWRMALNATGALVTTTVLVIVATVKFKHGAWIVLVAIPVAVAIFRKIREHYAALRRELSLADFERTRALRHTVIVPVPPAINKVTLAAIEYAKSISRDIIAVMVNTEHRDSEEIRAQWSKHVDGVPLIVVDSPYRSVLQPLLRFIDEVADLRPGDEITIVLPEFVPRRWWHNLLHNQTSLLLKGALLFRSGLVVTSVPYHVRH